MEDTGMDIRSLKDAETLSVLVGKTVVVWRRQHGIYDIKRIVNARLDCGQSRSVTLTFAHGGSTVIRNIVDFEYLHCPIGGYGSICEYLQAKGFSSLD